MYKWLPVQPCYNGSYTMMAKPIKTLKLHYPMIYFLKHKVSHAVASEEASFNY